MLLLTYIVDMFIGFIDFSLQEINHTNLDRRKPKIAHKINLNDVRSANLHLTCFAAQSEYSEALHLSTMPHPTFGCNKVDCTERRH